MLLNTILMLNPTFFRQIKKVNLLYQVYTGEGRMDYRQFTHPP